MPGAPAHRFLAAAVAGVALVGCTPSGPASSATPGAAPPATTPAAGRDVVAGLEEALAGEQAAIYAYGVAGARLPAQLQPAARRLRDAHRARRDVLESALRARGATPRAPAPAYRLPAGVGEAAGVGDAAGVGEAAATLLAAVEERLAVRYDALASANDPALRRLAEAAGRAGRSWAAQWRAAAASRRP